MFILVHVVPRNKISDVELNLVGREFLKFQTLSIIPFAGVCHSICMPAAGIEAAEIFWLAGN